MRTKQRNCANEFMAVPMEMEREAKAKSNCGICVINGGVLVLQIV